MPADTDRTDLTPGAAPGTPGATPGPHPGSPSGTTSGSTTERAPVWPVTALAVLLGWCLLGWTVFAGLITTAPFFGDTPSRDQYIESGLLALTALLPIALLVTLAVLAGSRWGLALLGVPALLLVPLGVSMLAQEGDPSDSHAGRPVRLDDAFQDLTRPNWLSAAVLLVALGLVLWRRRHRTSTRARTG